jgi:hypothetical protein
VATDSGPGTGADEGVTPGEGEGLEESWDLGSIGWESIGGEVGEEAELVECSSGPVTGGNTMRYLLFIRDTVTFVKGPGLGVRIESTGTK